MEYKFIAAHLLHELGVCRSRSGFDCILSALRLIDEDRDYLCFVTKSLYIDIAKEFMTTPVSVEKNIRTVVNWIWNHVDVNEKVILKVFGVRYLQIKPTNAEFLEMLYDYVKGCKLIEVSEKVGCPYSERECALYCERVYMKVER